ncbi:hypothetical protein LCGC14_2096730 [marine sediment metagenome]|uniref:Uncharacterized protein n=1 Tax=marine sediment metagenome TaxID=412755 RepID=A0A0F9H7U1_9ZZZZ
MWPTKPSPAPARNGGFEECTSEQFARALGDLMDSEYGGRKLMAIPGIYEILSEELNNEVLEEWAFRQNRCEECGQRMTDDAYCRQCEPEEEEDGPAVGTAEGGAAPGCLD